MALTATQLRDFAGDLGIADDEEIFNDAELNRFYARAEDDYELAVVLGLTQLLRDPYKFDKYAACHSDKDKEALRKILKDALQDAKETAGVTGGRLRTGVMSLGLDQPDPSTDTTYGDYLRDF